MKNVKFLLIKDCLPCELLPTYGNNYWSTPNIDELAKKGTVFNRHYTAGGSTAMSLSAMFSGHYLHEFQSRKVYKNVIPNEFPGIFERFQKLDYECHIIWDETWQSETWYLVREFGDEEKVKIHTLTTSQSVGFHKHSDKELLLRNNDLLEETYRQIKTAIDEIDYDKKQFIVMHLPHVLKGRRSYGDDIDVFDNIIGYIRNKIGDDSIYITSDHGHMNMHKGLVGYGFHIYEPVARIPLITPRINDFSEYNKLTSNIDICSIMLDGKIPEHDIVYSDVAYYGQPHRVLAIIGERYKYIYNKLNKTEELYDLLWDPMENYNIAKDEYFDSDRQAICRYDEMFFYPYKKEALEIFDKYRNEKNKVWKNASFCFELFIKCRRLIGKLYNKLRFTLK